VFQKVDWGSVFRPDIPLLEIIVRGTIVYLSLLILLRLVLKREAGAVGMTDLLVLVLLADASQNAMAGEYRSLPDGIVLVSTIIFWSLAVDWLGFRIPFVGRLVHPPPLPLIKDGRLLRRNMRRELITMEELMSQLRLQGVDDVSSVRQASMEGDGRISVIRSSGEQSGARDRQIG
jgi:uncharacterized membrane protein YcaP (DUF421 family)